MTSAVSSSERTIRLLADEVAKLKTRITDLERGVKGTQLGDSSIENGYLSVYDEAGVERARIGKQEDGTYVGGSSRGNATPPVVPATPIVTPGFGTLKITAPGPIAGARWAYDFSHISVYLAGTSYDQTGKVVGKITATPNTFVIGPLPIEVHRVWLTSTNQSGAESAASEEVAGLPTQVVGTDILDGAVSTLKLAADAVTAAKIAAGAVGTVALGDQVVDVTKLADGSVDGDKIMASAIAAGHIAAEAIRANHLAVGQIQAGHLAVGAIDTDRIAVNAIVAAHLTAQAITADKIAANTITAGNIMAGTLTGDLIKAGTVISDATVQSGSSGRRVVLDAAGNDIRFYPQAGETRYARIYSYIPINYPDDIALELRSVDSDTTDVVTRAYFLPDFAGMSVSPANATALTYTKMQVQLDRVIAGVDNPDLAGNPRDGGFLWLYQDDAWLGINSGSRGIDSFVHGSRNAISMRVTPGASRTGTAYIDNIDYAFFGLAQGSDEAGFKYSSPYATILTEDFLQVTSPSQGSYREVRASNVASACSASVKRDFAELPESALSVLRGAPITRWRRRGDPDGVALAAGPVAETLPEWLVRPPPEPTTRVSLRHIPPVLDDDGDVVEQGRTEKHQEPSGLPASEMIDYMSWMSIIAAAVRELDEELDEIRRDRGRPVPSRRATADLLSELDSGRVPRWRPRRPRGDTTGGESGVGLSPTEDTGQAP